MTLYCFGDFQLDAQARRLRRAGREVGIEPRVFDVVVYLIEQRERAVGRDELIAAAWGRVDSSDGTLAQSILKARRLLGDDGQAQRVIRTVARFGYQWVAAVSCEARPAAAGAERAAASAPGGDAADLRAADADPATPAAAGRDRPDTRAGGGARPPARFAFARLAAAVALATALAGMLVLAAARRGREAAPARSAAAPVPGLVAVLPAEIHSSVAQDGWMRLGLMAMSADALRALPRHAVVPSETVLAAGAGQGAADAARVRAATGAATIVRIEGRHERDRWLLEATLEEADGRRQSVGVEAGDAVAAGAALGERLRLAVGAGGREDAAEAPQALALAARMQADLLEGRAAEALALADGAGSALAASPRLRLLRAKAMNRLGRAAEAAAAMRALIADAPGGAAPWLSEAWTTLGYGELVGGRRDEAERAFRQAIAALDGDRSEAGRAWRGLGHAQAAGEDFDAAEASFLRATLELGGDGDRLLRAHLLDDLGTVAAHRGRFDEAIARYGEAAAAAAELGSAEVELGARINVALAQEERLQHSAALASWQALMPRIRAAEYPAMRRFAAIHHAGVLAETGALAQAAGELDAAAADGQHGARDALEDARLDALRVRLLLGQADRVLAEARALRTSAEATANLRADAGALELDAARARGDAAAARGAADALAAAVGAAAGTARARALRALAGWHAQGGEAARAQAAFGEALALVRATGSPRDLRDAALACADFQLARGELDAARATASLVGPYAADDFSITLLLSRLALAERNRPEAVRLRSQAKALAGARQVASLDDAAPALAVTAGER